MKNIELVINKDKVVEIKNFENANGKVIAEIEGKIVEADICHISEGYYSLLIGKQSLNVEISRMNKHNLFAVSCAKNFKTIEVLDAEAKYLLNRNKGKKGENENSIISPMPGKVVKVLVEKGDEVEENQTVIVIEAMKMQSEYKASQKSKVLDIKVKAGDSVNADQVLLIFE